MRLALVAIALIVGCAKGGVSAQQDSARNDTGGGHVYNDAPAVIIDADTCSMLPCALHPQCGCSGATPACDLGSGATTQCRAAGNGMEGTSCAFATTCAAGYVCVGDGTNNSCEKYCTSNADCNAPRGQCVNNLVNSSSMPIPGATVCTSNCDPSTATNALCPSGWTCDLFTAMYKNTTYDIADCRKAGPQALNATCSTTSTCQAGLSCISQGTTMSCKKLCNKSANTGCTTGTCTSFTTPDIIGGTEYGVCI
jgi:hypothetical protein